MSLPRAEYETTFAGALEGQSEEMFALRLARLSGIPLKRVFAKPSGPASYSRTNARRSWILMPAIQAEVQTEGPYPELESMREMKVPAYRLLEEVTKVRCGHDKVSPQEIAGTINEAQKESNWFTDLVKTVRPHVCKPGGENRLLIESFKKAAEALVNKKVEVALTAVIEPATKQLLSAVPLLHLAPHITAVGITYFIVKY